MPGDNEFSLEELDQLFKEDFEQEAPTANVTTTGDNTESGTQSESRDKGVKDIETTKAFASRLKKSTEKARAEERESIAKSLGYNSYEELQKSRENKLMEEADIDPNQASEVIDKIVKERIESDPRIKELEEYRKQKIKEFGEKELSEITKLTNGEITSLSQLSKEVIDLWKLKGSLKSAFLEVEGEKLINKIRSEQSRGSTGHLATPVSGSKIQGNERHLTEQERKVWKQFMPNITDEELDKKTVKIK